ncbi:MAG: hypothetical protein JO319_06870 [Acidobacteriaceae bacterium]|nr:hypothetical protein [Acidobacteriaceae bacterium]
MANVNAASTFEDRTNSGAYIGGQSETSIAASGNYVVEAWNDGTGFYAACGSPNYKEELTGYGFSSDGGKTFTDLGGLPNQNCVNGTHWSGDPSVGTYSNSGFTYFYISSLYACNFFPSCPNTGLQASLAVAVTACQVTGATLSCGQPTIVATGNCNGITNTPPNNCSPALDKDYLVVDQAHKRLYVTFTDFTFTYNGHIGTSQNAIEMAACDLDNPMAPVCSNGTTNGAPYVTVQPTDPAGCEQEGAYPAVRASTGDVYVAYEYNWGTNLFGNSYCVNSASTLVFVNQVPGFCLPDPDRTPTSPCAPPFNQNSNIIVSTDATIVPGYNRFLMNDFPRIAVSEPYHTVSLVWNDARNSPLGDILLQSYDLDSLNYIQQSPVQLNTDYSFEDMHTMPGLKNTSSDGLLNVTWYDRRGADAGSGRTDIYGALNLKPTLTSTPASNLKVTNQATDWLATSSVIVPNFGDYTDNFVSASNTLFIAWSDGRIGVPQPFEAHTGVH